MYIDARNRSNYGKRMDNYLREHINNEEWFWNIWAMAGIPDGATEEDYEDLEENDDFWTDCLEAFMRTVLMDAKEE